MEESNDKTPEITPENSRSTGSKPSMQNNRWLMIGLGAGALIILLIVLFLKGPLGGKVAATVNGSKIYQTQLDKEYNAYSKSFEQSNKKKPDAKMEKEIKKLILERLVQQELIKQAAEKEGISVGKKELDDRIDQIKKSTSKQQLEQTLKQMNWTEDDLRAMIENQLLSTKVREKVTKDLKVTDSDVSKYYKDNKKNYLVPDTVSAKIATFKKKSEGDEFAASVEGGKNFDEAVKKYIKGGVTAQQLSKDQILGIYGKELAEQAFGLGAGEMTSVVKTKNGIYVAKVEKKEKGHQKEFKEVKEEIKSMLVSQKQMEKFNTWIQNLKKKAKIDISDKDLKTTSNLPTNHP